MVTRYRFNWAYQSDRGQWQEGDEAEFEPDMADFLSHDSPGILEAVDAPPAEESVEPDTEAVDAPPAHRQVTRSPRKRGA